MMPVQHGAMRRIGVVVKSMLQRSLWLACAAFALSASAANPAVTISAPADGATLSANAKTKITYDAVPGPEGDHLHVYIDGKEVAQWRQFKGTHMLVAMPAGKHQICLDIATKAHVLLGVNKCISVTVQ